MRLLIFILTILSIRIAFALDAVHPMELPKRHEMVAVSYDYNMWFRGKPIDQQQLVAVILHLKTTEDLEVLIISADDDLDKNSEFYKKLISQLSSKIKLIDWKDFRKTQP